MAAADSRPASLVNVFRRLWPQIWRYRLRVGIALAFLVVAKLANIGVPLVLKHLVDALDVAPKPLLIPLLLLVAYGALRLSSSLFQELRQIVFARVMARVRDMRGGKDYDATFRTRMTGTGLWAQMLRDRFRLAAARLGYGRERQPLDMSQFVRPVPDRPRGRAIARDEASGQGSLF